MNAVFVFCILCVALGLVSAQTICLNEINNARRANGKGNLISNNQLDAAAYYHNNYMITRDCFSHQCPGEPDLGTRVSNTGYNWRGIGENIARGQTNCADVVNAWMNSAGHRANLLGDYQHVGCSGLACSSCSDTRPWWTCVHGNSF